jgi:photosystem II stability/assembly factor-like uncharacterized protein
MADDLRSRLLEVAELGERVAQPPPPATLRRRGRRRVARVASTTLAMVLAVAIAGVAVRDRVDRREVAVNPSAGSLPLPLVSDLGPIVGAQLLDAGNGWALTSDSLRWRGPEERWRTTSPRAAAGMDLLSAFFLDRRAGWLVAADLPRDGGPTELTAFRTTDGGVTWDASSMGQVSVQQSEDGTGPLYLSFVDARHGWLLVNTRLPGQSAEQETGTLFRTTDGGRGWQRLADAPTPGGIRFLTHQRGWQVWNDQLHETRDGGRTWSVVPLPPVPGGPGRLLLADLPTVFADGTGFLPVLLVPARSGASFTAGFLETRDGGGTWGPPRPVPRTSANVPLPAVAASGTLLVLVPDTSTVARSDDGGRTWRSGPTDLPRRGYTQLAGMAFVDGTTGWLLSEFLPGCSPDPTCGTTGALLRSRSGGRSWATILPGVR